MGKHIKVSLLVVIAFVGLLPVFQGIYAEELVILYTNDLHAQVEPMKATWREDQRLMGGFANIAAYVNEVRAAKKNVVFFDAGDMLTGPAISSLTQGEAVFDIINTMGFDAATLGNHEFDHGWENTKKLLYQADFPVLAANIFYEETNIPFAKPYEIIEKGDLKIGVIGILGKRCGDAILGTCRQGIEFREQEAIIQEYVNILEPHVDLIVLLTHGGKPGIQSSIAEADPQQVLQKDVEIAKNVRGIHVLITGHLHKGVEEPILIEETGTLIVSTYGQGIVVGHLELTIDKEKKAVIKYDGHLKRIFADEITPYPLTQTKIDYWNERLEKITGQAVGYAEVDLTRSYKAESLLGNLIADAMLESDNYDADIAFVNSFSIRANIDKGDITIGDILAALPFTDAVITSEMRGKDVLAILERSVSGVYVGLQQAGISVTYDPDKEAGNRVIEATVNGKKLDEEKYYTVATPDYLFYGGDGYTMFANGENPRCGTLVSDLLIEYIKSKRTIHPEIEGRIVSVKQ